MAEVLLANGSKHAWIVTGDGEIDEISVTGTTNIVELKDGTITEWTLDPSDFGISFYSPSDLKGGSPEKNAEIAIDIFSGRETGGKSEMVLLNASAGFVVAGVVSDIGQGLRRSKEAIETGAVVELLESLK